MDKSKAYENPEVATEREDDYEVCEVCDGSGTVGRDDDICHACNGTGIYQGN